MTWLTSAGGAIRGFLNGGNPVARPASASTDLMIVRTGLSPAFYFYCQVFATERRLQLVPDRRAGDRRHRQRPEASMDRRRSDRRTTGGRWLKEDFVIVRTQSNAASGPVES